MFKLVRNTLNTRRKRTTTTKHNYNNHNNMIIRGVSGKATDHGTSRFRAKFPDCAFYENSLTGLNISRLGFGSFRVDNDTHADALRAALSSGVNVIDTCSTYTNGKSEQIVGSVITDLVKSGKITRDEIVVMDKAGYIQGDILAAAKLAEANGNPWPEVEKLDESLWYSISPQFLENQITESLNRLGLETIDVFFLHNPEHFFSVRPRGSAFDQEFYRRIRDAFGHLQNEVKRGRIGWYGVSCNTFGSMPSADQAVSLEFLLVSARLVSANNRFGAIQFPLNSFEMSAFRNKNNVNETTSVMELAKRSGLLTISNRPLNAIVNDTLCFKLSLPPDHLEKDFAKMLKETVNFAIHLEKIYPGHDVNVRNANKLPSPQDLSWAHILASNIKSLDLVKYKETCERVIKPTVEKHLHTIAQIESVKDWGLTYKRTLWPLLDYFSYYLEHHRNYELKHFQEGLVGRVPMLETYKTVSQQAFQIPLSAGVNCELIGMRTTEYVNDAVQVLKRNKEPLEFMEEEWEKVFEHADKFGRTLVDKYTAKPGENMLNTPPSDKGIEREK